MSELATVPAPATAEPVVDTVPAVEQPSTSTAEPAAAAAEEPQPEPKKFLGKITYPSLLKLLLLLTLVGGLIIALTVGDLDSRIGDVFDWIDDNRVPGIFIFFAVYVGVTSAPPLLPAATPRSSTPVLCERPGSHLHIMPPVTCLCSPDSAFTPPSPSQTPICSVRSGCWCLPALVSSRSRTEHSTCLPPLFT